MCVCVCVCVCLNSKGSMIYDCSGIYKTSCAGINLAMSDCTTWQTPPTEWSTILFKHNVSCMLTPTSYPTSTPINPTNAPIIMPTKAPTNFTAQIGK